MWILLALSLLALQFNKKISLSLLIITVVIGGINGTLDWRSLTFLGVMVLIAGAYVRFGSAHRGGQYILEALLVAGAIGAMVHLIPGFHNLKVLDSVSAGPESVPFTMYYNFDKALVPFILLAGMKTLFVTKPKYQPSKLSWLLLILAIPVLLFVAVYLGGLKLETHLPAWFFQFVLANIFFVSLAEEALFRGYLQQRLSGFIHPVAALIISAAIFGGMHYAGGTLLVIFAALAGVIYGIAWMWSGRLWVAVAFHVGLNVVHLLFFTYPMLRHYSI
jgi:hypothetical protein